MQNMLAPAGPAALRIAHLGWFVLITFCVTTVVMWVLVFWLAARRRGTLTTHMAWDAPEDRRWIIVGGFAVPVAVLAIVFVLTLKTMAAFPMGDGDMHPSGPDVRVVGHQWWWEVHYVQGDVDQHVVSANEIHIPAGRPVNIELQSRDVIHSFWVPRLHGKVDLIPGVVNRIRVQADHPGRFRGECAEYCGPQHAKMILAVVADSPLDYQKWLDNERADGNSPSTELAEHGQQLFMAAQCALCHTIRGTEAHGLVGPDLTHVGRRLAIASNALPNSIGTLEAWVSHAQSLKPYAQMPNLTVFRGDDLRAVAEYLRSLQ